MAPEGLPPRLQLDPPFVDHGLAHLDQPQPGSESGRDLLAQEVHVRRDRDFLPGGGAEMGRIPLAMMKWG